MCILNCQWSNIYIHNEIINHVKFEIHLNIILEDKPKSTNGIMIVCMYVGMYGKCSPLRQDLATHEG